MGEKNAQVFDLVRCTKNWSDYLSMPPIYMEKIYTDIDHSEGAIFRVMNSIK